MNYPRVMGSVLSLLVCANPQVLKADQPAPVLEMPQMPKLDGELVPATFGVQVYYAKPMTDLKDLKTGIGGGLFMEESVSPTTIVQTRVDYVSYKQSNGLVTPNTLGFVPPNVTSLAADAAGIGVDVRHYLPYPWMKRFYIMGGMSATRYEFKALANGTALDLNGLPIPNSVLDVKSKTLIRWGLDLGLGVDIIPGYAVTARYTYLPVDTRSLAALEYGLRISF